jgi:hypothetical protein
MKALKGETTTDTQKADTSPTVKPLNELSLIKEITDFYHDPEQRSPFRPGIHPSEISAEDPFCPRWHVYRRYLVESEQMGKPYPFGVTVSDREIDPDLARVFEMGHAVHSMYQDAILARAGLIYGFWERWNDKAEKWEQERGFRPQGRGWRYIEPKIRTKGVRGQCDGIIRLDNRWFALEIKSSNDQAFTFRKKVKREHMRQAQVYAELGFVDFPEIDVEGIIFLYVNKNTSKEREFIVPRDASVIRDILDGLEVLTQADKEDRLPERVCLRHNSKRANACPVSKACFSMDSGKDGLIQIRNACR